MRKQEFLDLLKAKLSGLPKEDIEERLVFYGEMIDDRMEEGLTEEEAVSEIGSADEVAEQLIAETPLSKIVKEKIKPKRRLRAWEIVLLVLGSPIWLSLAIAAFAVILSLYAVLWSLIASLWAIFGALVGCALSGIASGTGFAIGVNVLTGIALVGAGIICAGLSVFLFFGCLAATKGSARLTGMIALGIKKCFIGKEKA